MTNSQEIQTIQTNIENLDTFNDYINPINEREREKELEYIGSIEQGLKFQVREL